MLKASALYPFLQRPESRPLLVQKGKWRPLRSYVLSQSGVQRGWGRVGQRRGTHSWLGFIGGLSGWQHLTSPGFWVGSRARVSLRNTHGKAKPGTSEEAGVNAQTHHMRPSVLAEALEDKRPRSSSLVSSFQRGGGLTRHCPLCQEGFGSRSGMALSPSSPANLRASSVALQRCWEDVGW